MKILHYKIQFFSDWLCGSGLSSGSNADIVPIIDKQTGLPYIPGKTIKGLIREELDFLQSIGKVTINYDRNDHTDSIAKGIDIFGNAEINEKIDAENIPFLFRDLAGVKMTDNGVAEQQSLRVKKVVIPVTLYGKLGFDEHKFNEQTIISALKMIKSLGEGRNKGLGRCQITVVNEQNL